ncbi:MAG: inorganic phosphate transporter [Pseudomonadota bacterium]
METTLQNISIAVILCFAFVNGFHDGGNVLATAVCSRSVSPVRALLVAASAEFAGPLILGTAVAQTIAANILNLELLEELTPARIQVTLISAAAGAIIWKLPSWYWGFPSSGSHALVGGLVGAGYMAIGIAGIEYRSILLWVILPMLVAPIIGMVFGFLVFGLIRTAAENAHRSIGRVFARLQSPTMAFLAASHGSNDAQKSMGLIALAMMGGSGELHGELIMAPWVAVACAAALACGLTVGAWRIVKSVGQGICRMQPVHSFASQATAMSVILTASLLGGPVSTTQVVASSVMGVGAAERLGAVRWNSASNIAYAWLLTVPVSALLGALIFVGLVKLIPV